MPRHWLMKSEPDVFSFDDLRASPDQTTCWDGVRNFKARRYLRDEIQVGDHVFFYHSRVNPPVVVGTALVVRAGYPDPTQFDAKSEYADPRSNPENPKWFAVDVKAEAELERPVSLHEIKATPDLAEMVLVNAPRLSVQPVTPEEWEKVWRCLEAVKCELSSRPCRSYVVLLEGRPSLACRSLPRVHVRLRWPCPRPPWPRLYGAV